MNKIEENLAKLNIKLPIAAKPIANYVGYTIAGKLVFISGQLPKNGDKLEYSGKVGEDISIDDAKKAAGFCLINVIAQLKDAVDGDLSKVKSCIKLGVFINCTENFTDHSTVANGASDLLVDIFENKGKHARAAVGNSSLPLGASVEVEGIFEIE